MEDSHTSMLSLFPEILKTPQITMEIPQGTRSGRTTDPKIGKCISQYGPSTMSLIFERGLGAVDDVIAG